MNPFRYRGFALMLISHKLLRWLPYLLAPVSFLALGFLAKQYPIARALFTILCLTLLIGTVGIRQSRWSRIKPIAAAGFLVAAFTAGFLAWWDVLRGAQIATWEPTPRPDSGTCPVPTT